jgi:hypothetical protein
MTSLSGGHYAALRKAATGVVPITPRRAGGREGVFPKQPVDSGPTTKQVASVSEGIRLIPCVKAPVNRAEVVSHRGALAVD